MTAFEHPIYICKVSFDNSVSPKYSLNWLNFKHQKIFSLTGFTFTPWKRTHTDETELLYSRNRKCWRNENSFADQINSLFENAEFCRNICTPVRNFRTNLHLLNSNRLFSLFFTILFSVWIYVLLFRIPLFNQSNHLSNWYFIIKRPEKPKINWCKNLIL